MSTIRYHPSEVDDDTECSGATCGCMDIPPKLKMRDGKIYCIQCLHWMADVHLNDRGTNVDGTQKNRDICPTCQAYIQPDTMFGIQYYQRTKNRKC